MISLGEIVSQTCDELYFLSLSLSLYRKTRTSEIITVADSTQTQTPLSSSYYFTGHCNTLRLLLIRNKLSRTVFTFSRAGKQFRVFERRDFYLLLAVIVANHCGRDVERRVSNGDGQQDRLKEHLADQRRRSRGTIDEEDRRDEVRIRGSGSDPSNFFPFSWYQPILRIGKLRSDRSHGKEKKDRETETEKEREKEKRERCMCARRVVRRGNGSSAASVLVATRRTASLL